MTQAFLNTFLSVLSVVKAIKTITLTMQKIILKDCQKEYLVKINYFMNTIKKNHKNVRNPMISKLIQLEAV